ncbi:D-alanyl-D-alanine carboxypeptidase family protein [Hoeflea marina]|nr:D-alanyl-D-alanine carboxypeptidase family protein [Hoeflea marina]
MAGLLAASLPLTARAGPTIAVDLASGRVIEHEQAFQRWYPASLTKLMTTYVTFRALKAGRLTLDSPVTMTEQAAKEPASKMYFKPGTQFPLDSALKYLMVKSANDIAVAVAQAVGGSVETFVAMMNSEAARIGMTSSHFINPNGLPGEGQYTTAHDMAVLAVALRREFPEYASYFSLEGFTTGKQSYTNFNALIGRFQGADGMKTGYICASGFNQVSSATRNGKTVVTVVFGAPSLSGRAEESARLLQQAFAAPASGSVTLSSLAPYGADRDHVADVSATVCPPKQSAAKGEGTGEEGKAVARSPYLQPMDHPPRLVSAPYSPGMADVLGVKRIPVPTPRPLDGPGSNVAADAEATASESAFAAPAAAAGLDISAPQPLPRPAL